MNSNFSEIDDNFTPPPAKQQSGFLRKLPQQIGIPRSIDRAPLSQVVSTRFSGNVVAPRTL